MIKIKLFTRDGLYVTTVMVPDFNPMAEAIVWGSRIFFYSHNPAGYREGLAYHCLDKPVPEETEGE